MTVQLGGLLWVGKFEPRNANEGINYHQAMERISVPSCSSQ